MPWSESSDVEAIHLQWTCHDDFVQLVEHEQVRGDVRLVGKRSSGAAATFIRRPLLPQLVLGLKRVSDSTLCGVRDIRSGGGVQDPAQERRIVQYAVFRCPP